MAGALPSDLQQAKVAARFEILKYIRGKKILILGAFIILVLALLTAAPYLLGQELPSEPRPFAEFYIMFATILIIVIVTLFGSDSLSTEFEHRTGLLMFPQPMKRGSLFVGKFLASFLMSLVMVLAYYAAVLLLSYLVTGSVYSELYTSLGLAALYVLAATGFGFMLSAFLSRGATAAILLFALLMLIFPIAETVLFMADIEPWFSIHYAGEAVFHSIAGPWQIFMGFGTVDYNPETYRSAAVMAAWTIATAGLALLRFKSKEI